MNTKKLKQLVLDLAIHGKLVPQDPNDEPASVLLERIKAEKSKTSKGKKTTNPSDNFDDVPFEVPEGWCWCKLSDIADIGTGSTPATTNKSYYGGSIAWITSGSTKENYINSPISFITDLALKETNCQVYPIGTLIMAMYGEGKTRGQISELSINAATNQACAAIQLFDNSLKNYVKAYLMGNYWTLREMAEGGLQPNLNLKKISSYFIPLPPLSEQKRIVAEIEKWFVIIDELEENATGLKKSVEQAKRKVLDLAIHGKLVEQDPNDEPASVLLERIVETHGRASKRTKTKSSIPSDNLDEVPFVVPEGWCWTRLGKIGKWQSGSTPSRSNKRFYGGDIPWLKTGDLNDGFVTEIPEYITEEALNNTSVKLNPTDSVLIAMYGATIGKVGILTFPATTNQACCACSEYCVNKMYLFYFLIQERENFISKAGGGAQPNISKEIIVDTLIPLPPLSEQKRIVRKIEEVFGELDRIVEMIG